MPDRETPPEAEAEAAAELKRLGHSPAPVVEDNGEPQQATLYGKPVYDVDEAGEAALSAPAVTTGPETTSTDGADENLSARICECGGLIPDHPIYGLIVADRSLVGDDQHPDQRDYMARNLLAHIDKMPDTGDWHSQLRNWAAASLSDPADAIRASSWPDSQTSGEGVAEGPATANRGVDPPSPVDPSPATKEADDGPLENGASAPVPELIEEVAREMERVNTDPDQHEDDWYVLLAKAAVPVVERAYLDRIEKLETALRIATSFDADDYWPRDMASDDLIDRKLVEFGVDMTGEAYTQPTAQGQDFIRAALASLGKDGE